MASATSTSARGSRPAPPSRSRTASAKAIRRPPDEGGGFETNSAPRRQRADGTAPDDAVGGEIGLGDRASRRLRDGAHAPRELAAVEHARRPSAASHSSVPARSSHDQRVPLAEGASRRRTALALGLVPEDDVEDLVEERLAGVEGNPGAGELERRREQLGPGQPAVEAVRLRRARHAPRHGTRRRRRRGRPGSSCRRRRRRPPPSRPLAVGSPARVATKKSSRLSTRSRARWTSRKPPPPGPVSGLSATQETNAAAMQASTAFPPSARIRAPASAVEGWPAATAPFMGEGSPPVARLRGRSGSWAARADPRDRLAGAGVGRRPAARSRWRSR